VPFVVPECPMAKASQTLPPAFVERIRRVYPGRDGETALAAFEKPRPTSFRPNLLKMDARALKAKLEEQGFKLEAVPYPTGAFILRNRRQRDLEDTFSYQNGELYVQNLSSMVPPLLLDPKPGEIVLDMAAAPGSKTTQMAAIMGDRGKIHAMEENLIRAEKLKANLNRQGVSIATVEVVDGAVAAKKTPGLYDKVLLDAPCSAEGRFQSEERSSFGYWKEDTPAKAAKLQRRLFRAAVEALKVGGRMVYSTCAISPEENEGLVAWALAEFPGRLEVLPATVPLTAARPGLGAWGATPYHESVRKTLRIMPTPLLEGFYAAVLRKTS